MVARGEGQGSGTTKGQGSRRELFGVMELFCILMVMKVAYFKIVELYSK